MRDYQLYLKDILSAMDSIEAFVEGMSFEEFRADDKTASAVIRKFEIIGEATKNIPDEIRHQYPTVPWKEMAGNEGQTHSFLFWRGLQACLDDHQRTFASGQARNSVYS